MLEFFFVASNFKSEKVKLIFKFKKAFFKTKFTKLNLKFKNLLYNVKGEFFLKKRLNYFHTSGKLCAK